MGGWPPPDTFRLENLFMPALWRVIRVSAFDSTIWFPETGMLAKKFAIAKCVELQLQGHTVDMSVLDV